MEHIEPEIEENDENIDNNETKKIDLDSILANEIGQLGAFQLRTFGLAACIIIFSAFSTYEYMFTTARISTRCVIPECEGDVPEWSPSWLSNAIPPTGKTTFDNCHRFGNTSTAVQVNNNKCLRTLFDRNRVQKCKEYVYENQDTVAYDFNLACDEWSRSLLGAIRTLGAFIGLSFTGIMSDRWGRRIALSFGVCSRAWIGLARYYSNTYSLFLILKLFEGVLGGGSEITVYILVLELMGPKYRMAGGAAIISFFTIGEVFLGLIAWAVPNWKSLILALYIPQLLTISCYWVMPESVRWYMSKGRFKESEAFLKHVAKINGTQLSAESLQALRDTVIEEAAQKAVQEEYKSKEPWLIVQVFQHNQILLRVLVAPVWWVTNSLVAYGLSVNSVNLTGSRLSFVALALAELPGFWTAVFLMEKIGRKPVLIVAYFVCACSQISHIFLPSGVYAWSLAVFMIGKFSISITLSSVYAYTAELYPTKYRNSLQSYCSMIGRIGAMIAPLTPAFSSQWYEGLPFLLFGGFAFLSSALVFTTPETLGTKLPDTFEEATQLGVKHNENLYRQVQCHSERVYGNDHSSAHSSVVQTQQD